MAYNVNMNINRHVLKNLEAWKALKSRMPLVLKGARQVGKTHLVREFSKQFPKYFEFNFQKNPNLKSFFELSNDPIKIIESLSIHAQSKININKDLIFFDEVQDCPEALNSLKFFCENYPNAFIVAAGSLLGIYLSSHSFPVGKVKFQNVFPLSFSEFLEAMGEVSLSEILFSSDFANTATAEPNKDLINTINSFHLHLTECLKKYYLLGGMPKIVSSHLEKIDAEELREDQLNLLLAYRADFAKYSGPTNALKILSVFENIPKQLAKDNRKFQFKLLKDGARFAEFSSAIDWLVSAGLCHKVPILEHAEIPLKVAQNENFFKLYFFDVGLLGALSDLPLSVFSSRDPLFSTFKGAFAENFFLQDFVARRKESLFSWVGKMSEVDFLYTHEMSLYPIEVKSGESGKLKSLNVFASKYSPPFRTRCSLKPLEFNTQTNFRNFPLYLASRV